MPNIAIEEYPSGNVTFVIAEVDGASVMASRSDGRGPDFLWRNIQGTHQDRLKAEVNRQHGFEILRQGDGHLFVFQRAADALACMVAFQRSLRDDPIFLRTVDDVVTIRVRVGIHTTERQRNPALMENGLVEYPGSDTIFAVRVGGLGRGGQILVSETTAREVRHLDGCRLRAWPHRLLRGFEEKAYVLTEILYHPDQEALEPGMQWLPEWYQAEKKLYVPRPELEALVVEQFRRKGDDTADPSRWRSIGQDGPRIVTLKAEGGMGKTRLAVQCAAQVADLFPDGVYFVPLATTPPTVEAVAAAIGQGIGMAAKDSLPANVLTVLKGRTVLLVLDNYESVEDPTSDPDRAVARFLIRLITEIHGLRLLVTGRSAVNVHDLERVIEGSLDEGMTHEEARELFMQRGRSRSTQDNILIDAEELQLVRILNVTARIPLAIELAAAWLRFLELKEIADGLEEYPLGEETATPRVHIPTDSDTTQGRHYSLTRSFDWSYNLLARTNTPGAQTIFAICGLFADSFDEPTMATVSGSPNVREELHILLNASLIRRDPVDGATRYRLHRLAQEYAHHRLDEVPFFAEGMRRRFIAHYAQLIEKSAGDPNKVDLYTVLDKEWKNALGAQSVAVQIQDIQSLMRMIPLGIFLRYRGHWSEADLMYKGMLDIARNSAYKIDECVILTNLGGLFRARGRYDEALDAYSQSLAIYREFGDRVGEGGVLNNMGIVYQTLGRYDQALDTYAQSLTIRREFGDRVGEGQTLNNIGIVYRARGRYDEALDAYSQSLAIYREFGDRVGEGGLLNNIGIVYRARGRYDEALDAYSQSLAIRREFGDRVGEGGLLNNMGIIYEEQGRYNEALDAYSRSLAIRREFGDRVGEGRTLGNMGGVYESQGRYDEALDCYVQDLAICREFGDRVGEGQTLNNIGIVYRVQGRHDEAFDAFNKSLALYREFGDRVGGGQTLNNMGNVYQTIGQYDQALDVYSQSLDIYREFGDRVSEGQTLNNIGIVYQALSRYDEALDAYIQSLAIRREFGDRVGEGQTLENLALMAAIRGDLHEAIQLVEQAVTVLKTTEADVELAEARRLLTDFQKDYQAQP